MKHVTILDNRTNLHKLNGWKYNGQTQNKIWYQGYKNFQDSLADWSEGLFTHTGTAVFYSINCYVLVCTLSIRLNIDG